MDISHDLSLIRPCLSDFELPVVLVDLILHYVQRMLEERYYTRRDLRNMTPGISQTFILNMKIISRDFHSEKRTTHECECEVDVILTKFTHDFKFIMDGVDYDLVGGRIFEQWPPYIWFIDKRMYIDISISCRPHEFE